MAPWNSPGWSGRDRDRSDWDRRWRNWNYSKYSQGRYRYSLPSLLGSFFFGYWIGRSTDCYSPYCYYSPFRYYGLPYVYAPRVRVVTAPVYTYAPVPYYSHSTTANDYYLSGDVYPGLNAALADITRAWTARNADLMLRHVDSNVQVAIFQDGEYLYTLSGQDYRAMVRDAMSRVRTTSFVLDNLERRSDGALTATGRHDFYDVDGTSRSVDVSFTLARVGSRWVIVAAGSSETA